MTTDTGRLRSVVFSDGCCMDFETAPDKADGWPYEGVAGAVFRCPHGKLHEVVDPNPPVGPAVVEDE